MLPITAMTLPNLFVIGAPKCGTGTIHLWLGRHTQVFMSDTKEPAHFTDFARATWSGPAAAIFAAAIVRERSDYEALFSGGAGREIIGESSTDYLWRPETPARIATACGDARFIAVLRDPVARAFSEHMHLVRDGYEHRSFADALELEDRRFEEGWIPLFYHRRRGAYAQGLGRYFDRFGRDRVKVLIFEECFLQPGQTVAELTEFLRIVPEPCHTDYRTNVSGVPRSRLLHAMTHTPLSRSNPLRVAWRAVMPPRLRSRLKAYVDEKNTRKVALSPAEREAAWSLFENEVSATEALLGRHLPAWRTHVPP